MNDDDSPTHHDPTHHAHEHEHEHEHAGTASFPHEKLDAYDVALKMAVLAKKTAQNIPRGHRNVADHMVRAAANAVLLLAEGANRRASAEKRQRFVESRGECGEVAAAADLVLLLDLTSSRAGTEELKRLAARVSAMLTRLIALFGGCG